MSVTYIFLFSVAYLLSLGCCVEREERYDEELNSYLDCEARGVTDKNCSRAAFEELDTEILFLPTALIAIGYPIVDVVYILNAHPKKKAGTQGRALTVTRSVEFTVSHRPIEKRPPVVINSNE